MSNKTQLNSDEREIDLWEVSHHYAVGELEREHLKDIEHSHTKVFRQALKDFARGIIRGKGKKRLQWTDEDEEELWKVSWLYMDGKADVKQLEYVELPHTISFRRALLSQAKYHLRRHFINLFFIRKKGYL